jgi:PIN domain nuclease of toxin-antitoxin system
MNLLLDTHTFIWWDSDPYRLSPFALAVVSDPNSLLWLSTASLWEMQIKLALGKLTLRIPLNEIVAQQQAKNGIQLLNITAEHVFALNGLPAAHKDPFDRLLVAQANSMGAALVSADPIFASYSVQVIW